MKLQNSFILIPNKTLKPPLFIAVLKNSYSLTGACFYKLHETKVQYFFQAHIDWTQAQQNPKSPIDYNYTHKDICSLFGIIILSSLI